MLAHGATVGIASDADTPPEWLHLLPAGEVRTIDGRGPYRALDLQSVIRSSMLGGKLVLDENHATDLAAPKGLPAPACAWIVQLQQRADGLWGRVDWTEVAKRAGLWRAYRGVSPVIIHRKDGTILSIARASLTNTPNFQGLTTLHAQDRTMTDTSTSTLRIMLAPLLDLPENATDRAIVDAVEALVTKANGGKTPDVSFHSEAGMSARLRERANTYQDVMRKLGMPVEYAEAVRAVTSGEVPE